MGNGMIVDRRASIRTIDQPGVGISPFPTGRNLFFVATRHFVPGYLHLVPSGHERLCYSVRQGDSNR